MPYTKSLVTTSIVPDTKAQSLADDINSTFRAYTQELEEVRQATVRAMGQAQDGYKLDASWITHHANKATEYQREIETLIRMAHLVGLTKEQIELAASSARVWFQTPEEAAEYEASK